MQMTAPQRWASIFLALLIVMWGALYVTHTTEGFYNYLYSFLFGLIPLIGGFIAMTSMGAWGGFKTAIGKAVFFIGLGLFLWGCGESIWSYYNFFLGVAAPYPSLADVGFAPSIFFYGLGAIYLSQATGAKYGFRSPKAKVFVMLAIALVSAVSYYVLITLARGGMLLPEGETLLKAVLDIAYPLGDFLGLMSAVIISGLSFKYMGGKHILDVAAILTGLFVMYVADSIFSYTTTVGTYYNADFGDLVLALGLFFLTYGVLGFYKSRAKR